MGTINAECINCRDREQKSRCVARGRGRLLDTVRYALRAMYGFMYSLKWCEEVVGGMMYFIRLASSIWGMC